MLRSRYGDRRSLGSVNKMCVASHRAAEVCQIFYFSARQRIQTSRPSRGAIVFMISKTAGRDSSSDGLGISPLCRPTGSRDAAQNSVDLVLGFSRYSFIGRCREEGFHARILEKDVQTLGGFGPFRSGDVEGVMRWLYAMRY